MLTEIIILNVAIAILGAVFNFFRSASFGVDKSDSRAATSGVVCSVVALLIFWSAFTYNVSAALLLSYTWPCLFMGAGLGVLVRRILK